MLKVSEACAIQRTLCRNALLWFRCATVVYVRRMMSFYTTIRECYGYEVYNSMTAVSFCPFEFDTLAILFDQHVHVPSVQLNWAFLTPSGVPLVHNNRAFATFFRRYNAGSVLYRPTDTVLTGIITDITMPHSNDAGFFAVH